MLLSVKPTSAPHGRTGALPRETPRRDHLARTKSYDPPYQTISLPSVPNHLIGSFDFHRGFSTNTYAGLVWCDTFYYVNTSWRLYRWSLFPTNSTWDRPVRGHLQRITIISLANIYSLSTVQADSAKPDDDQRFLPLHPPVDRDKHPPSSNRPNDD